MSEPFPFPEPGDDKIPSRWKEHPPWKSDPDLADLLEIMQPLECDYWTEGGQPHQEREVFLARIEARWRRWRDLAWQRLGRKPERPGIDLTSVVRKILEDAPPITAKHSEPAKSPKGSRAPSHLNLQELEHEVNRATEIMAEAAEILRRKHAPETEKESGTQSVRGWESLTPPEQNRRNWQTLLRWLKTGAAILLDRNRLWRRISVWSVLGFLAAAAIGVGMEGLGLSPPDYLIARVSFIVAAFLLLAGVVHWLVVSTKSNVERLIASVVLGGLIIFALVQSLRWVKRRELQAQPVQTERTQTPVQPIPIVVESPRSVLPVPTPTPSPRKARPTRSPALTEEEKWILRQLNSNKNAHATQASQKITKNELKSVLSIKLSQRGYRLLVDQVRKRGVNFLLTSETEGELRRFASQSGNTNIDSLIDAIRENPGSIHDDFLAYESYVKTQVHYYRHFPEAGEDPIRMEVRLVFNYQPHGIRYKQLAVYIPRIFSGRTLAQTISYVISKSETWAKEIETIEAVGNTEFSSASKAFSWTPGLLIFNMGIISTKRAELLKEQGHTVKGVVREAENP